LNQDGRRICPGTRGEAEALADRYFIETAIRLHRAGKGAPYTGLKPAEANFGPAILAAERTVESGDFKMLEVFLVEEVRRMLRERLAQGQTAQAASMKSDTRPGVRAPAIESKPNSASLASLSDSILQPIQERGSPPFPIELFSCSP